MAPALKNDSELGPHDERFPWAASWPEIDDLAVRAAFARVERAHFVPASVRDQWERDAPLPIGEGQTISQPFVIALMVQALALQPGDRVLEIGTGSGYQTAILCEMVRKAGSDLDGDVYSMERFESLYHVAVQTLHSAGYWPHLAQGDGARGWPEAAPYDGIVVSAAASHVPRPLYEQLAPGGWLVIPVGPQGDEQALWRIRRPLLGHGDAPERRYLGPVRFVPLVSPLLANPANWMDVV